MSDTEIDRRKAGRRILNDVVDLFGYEMFTYPNPGKRLEDAMGQVLYNVVEQRAPDLIEKLAREGTELDRGLQEAVRQRALQLYSERQRPVARASGAPDEDD